MRPTRVAARVHQIVDELAPAVQRLQPGFRTTTPGPSSLSSDRWIAWQSLSSHSALIRNAERINMLQRCYRARLRRFVLQHRDRALDVVSTSAEMEAEVRPGGGKGEERGRIVSREGVHIPGDCLHLRLSFPELCSPLLAVYLYSIGVPFLAYLSS